MDITGLDKAEVLAALYNRAKPLGLGFSQYTPEKMTKEEAQSILDEYGKTKYFDYLKGRVIKVDLTNNEIRTDLYNRDNGQGAAENILAPLIAKL
jgi:hypothetical protein